MAFDPDKLIEPLPSAAGGLIETVKKGVIVALRTAINGSSIQVEGDISVDMEYPMEKETYPGLWVQFSVNDLRPSGMGMLEYDPDTGDRLQQFMYTGRVTIVIVALTSLERDRLSDFLISMLTFSRIPNPRVFTEHGVDEGFSGLYAALDENPHLSMTVNTDTIRPGGQTTTVGVPWDPTQLAYEDAHSFEVLGEFQLITQNDGNYILRRIDVLPEIGLRGAYKPGDWV